VKLGYPGESEGGVMMQGQRELFLCSKKAVSSRLPELDLSSTLYP
jgi:hypothetical protein